MMAIWSGDRQCQQGFVLPLAIFLMVVLGSLGAYAAKLSFLSSASSIQDVQATRAYFAARAGVEWAAMRTTLAPGTNSLSACPTDTMPLSIEGFAVTVSCNSPATYSTAGGDQTVAVYEISAVARRGVVGGTDYVERQVNITISRCLRGTVACN